MIPLTNLRILTLDDNHLAIGVGFIMPPGLPVGIGIVGFNDLEELPEIADYLYKQVMYLYENWDKFEEETPIPDAFKEAFDDTGEAG